MFTYPVMTVTHFIREPVLKRTYLASKRFVFRILVFIDVSTFMHDAYYTP